jgi:autotransporter strand-loop-strand O-heptosyltransferase
MYHNITKLSNIVRNLSPVVNVNFIDGPMIEIKNFPGSDYDIRMYSNSQLYYSVQLSNNMWAKASKKYFDDWRINISKDGKIIWEYKIDLTDKRVFITFESKSLGDTLAWFPYVEEFRKKWNCHVIVSTFMNKLFVENYPEIEFVEPGTVVDNLTALYRIGWFYDTNGNFDQEKHPSDFTKHTLQKTASDILGLEYREIRPRLTLQKVQKKKKVGIAIHSTAQAKYWNNPEGWQQVVDYLKQQGYEVVLYSKEENGFMGNFHPYGVSVFPNGSIEDLIKDICSCEFFIGLGSGLSWLAWACKIPVILISGFSDSWAEMSDGVRRIINKDVCNSCFNNYKFDPGDWNWCPVHKGTSKQFECTKKISSQMVIDEINKIIHNDINI